MKINDRLKHIGDLVEANSFCLDIGCDHAFLDIYLVKQNKNIKAIASDIAEGPVKQARENIKREGLEDTIEVRLGNGLDTYSDEVNTVIIAGMGDRKSTRLNSSHVAISYAVFCLKKKKKKKRKKKKKKYTQSIAQTNSVE